MNDKLLIEHLKTKAEELNLTLTEYLLFLILQK